MNINLFISILIIPASTLLNGTIVAINLGLVRVDTKGLILKITLEMYTLRCLMGCGKWIQMRLNFIRGEEGQELLKPIHHKGLGVLSGQVTQTQFQRKGFFFFPGFWLISNRGCNFKIFPLYSMLVSIWNYYLFFTNNCLDYWQEICWNSLSTFIKNDICI